MTTTLALDAAYQPLGRKPWQEAVADLISGRAELVEAYDRSLWQGTYTLDTLIQLPYFGALTVLKERDEGGETLAVVEFRMPSIIRFLTMRGRKRAIKFSRENVYLRDKGRCAYCSKKVDRSEATYDHVVPRASGGKTNWRNIVIACVLCNQKKGHKSVQAAKMRLAVRPVRPKKLPNLFHLKIAWTPDDPPSWRQFLMDASYWHGKLDHGE